MGPTGEGDDVLAVKDETAERPIPTAWRPVYRQIVEALVRKDYRLEFGILGVQQVSAKTAAQIRDYIDGYGANLVTLSEETWKSSVCIWMDPFWDVLLDLWTESEGRSDMVLSTRVREEEQGYVFEIYMVYVP